MEEETLKEPWTWFDEVLRVDSEPSSEASDSLWDACSQNDAVVRSLFPAASHFKDSFDSDFLPGANSSWEIMPECNPSLFKRRRSMYSHEDDAWDNSLITEGDSLHAVGTTSPKLIPNEDSFSSVHEDTPEFHTVRRMEGCFNESEMSNVEELFHRHISYPMDFSGSKSSAAEDNTHLQARTRTPCGSILMNNLTMTPGKLHEPGQVQMLKQGQNPLFAYPFALLKPSAMRGDLTLQDINQRINKSLPVGGTASDESKSIVASPLSGKSVVSCTKIYTEGKGTITIMKTRCE